MKSIQTAVILAAGKSTRTYPITLETPKALLKIVNKTIIERTLDELHGLVREVIIVVGHKKEMIQSYLGKSYRGISLRYVEQKEVNGTGGALLACKPFLKGKFIVINGDDLYKKEDISVLLQYPYAVLGQKVADPSRFGVFVTDKKGELQNLVEKPTEYIGNMVNAACYLLDDKIFDYEIKKSPRGEYELVDYLLYLAKKYGVQVVPVKKYWLALGYSWDLLKLNRYVLEHDFIPAKLKKVPKSVEISGKVSVGKNVQFGKNVLITGPVAIGDDVVIGDNTYILPYTVIENNVVIEEDSIVAESLIMDHVILHRDAKKRGAIVTPKYTISLN